VSRHLIIGLVALSLMAGAIGGGVFWALEALADPAESGAQSVAHDATQHSEKWPNSKSPHPTQESTQ
jgi:hypothetical protein